MSNPTAAEALAKENTMTQVKSYRKKPVVIKAIQYTGQNLEELRRFVPEQWRHNKISEPLGIRTLEGVMTVSEGDFVIKGTQGEFYPCKPAAFAATFEAVEE